MWAGDDMGGLVRGQYGHLHQLLCRLCPLGLLDLAVGGAVSHAQGMGLMSLTRHTMGCRTRHTAWLGGDQTGHVGEGHLKDEVVLQLAHRALLFFTPGWQG